MADLRIVLAVALGGALGCVARYGWGLAVARDGMPWGTVGVNLLGSFALGAIVFSEAGAGLSPEARMFLTVGFLGGFTTMSSFAVEFTGLAMDGDSSRAALHLLLNAVGSILAAFAGRAVALGWA